MYKNKNEDGTLNVSGKKIATLRKQIEPKISQHQFAVKLQNAGLDVDKNAVQKMECGRRFITDIELKTITRVLHVSADELLEAD